MRRRNRETRKAATMTRSTSLSARSGGCFGAGRRRRRRRRGGAGGDAEKQDWKSRPRSRARDVRRRVRRLRAETPRQRRGEEETRQLVVRVKASAASKRATRGSFFEGIFFCEGHGDDSLFFATSLVCHAVLPVSLVFFFGPRTGRAYGLAAARARDVIARSVLSRQPSPRRTPRVILEAAFSFTDAETAAPYKRAPLRSRPAPRAAPAVPAVVERERPGLLLEVRLAKRCTECTQFSAPAPAPAPARLRGERAPRRRRESSAAGGDGAADPKPPRPPATAHAAAARLSPRPPRTSAGGTGARV